MGSQMFSSAMRLCPSEILLRGTMVSICKTQTSISYNQKIARIELDWNFIPGLLDLKWFVTAKPGAS